MFRIGLNSDLKRKLFRAVQKLRRDRVQMGPETRLIADSLIQTGKRLFVQRKGDKE